MRFNWHKKIPREFGSMLSAILLLSFLVGSVSGAVFGILGATTVVQALRRQPAGLVAPPRSQPVAPGSAAGSSPVASVNVVDVVRRSTPAVVSIVITKDVPQLQLQSPFFSPFGLSPFGDQFFGDFFNQQPPESAPSPPKTEKQKVGGGTGFFVDASGLILTNKHVVSDETADYSVVLNSGKQYPAKVLSRDPANDLAVIKIEGAGFPTLPLGNSSNLKLGEPVIAIGNALGEFGNTVSTGVVSGLSRSITASGSSFGAEELRGVIQTDAAINPGNSGGPLLNAAGEVVGINTAVAQGAQNIGFAIPINEVKPVIDSVRQYGKIVRPFLGVRYVVITPELARQKQLPVDYGALIVRGDTETDLAVTPGSPADRAGLQENDIILEADGQKITPEHPLAAAVAGRAVGDKLALKVLHRGETRTVTVTLVERKS